MQTDLRNKMKTNILAHLMTSTKTLESKHWAHGATSSKVVRVRFLSDLGQCFFTFLFLFLFFTLFLFQHLRNKQTNKQTNKTNKNPADSKNQCITFFYSRTQSDLPLCPSQNNSKRPSCIFTKWVEKSLNNVSFLWLCINKESCSKNAFYNGKLFLLLLLRLQKIV